MLLCFGSPLVDIIVEVQDGFLNKYGMQEDKAVHATPKHCSLFEELLNLNPKILPGGSVTNTVRVIKWISKDLPVLYVGSIGKDNYGSLIKQQLEREKIDLYFTVSETKQTGKCAVLLSKNGENRSLVSDLGASKYFSFRELSENKLKHKIQSSQFVYFSVFNYLQTFFLGVSIEVVNEIVCHFKNGNKEIIINLGAPFLVNNYPTVIQSLFKYANVVVGNEKEFLMFANINKLFVKENNVESIFDKRNSEFFKNFPNKLLLVTRGPDSILTYKNELLKYFDVKPVENIVDTNAAGDAFIGGFLAKYVEREPLAKCVDCGIWCARNIVQSIGCEFDKQLKYDVK